MDCNISQRHMDRNIDMDKGLAARCRDLSEIACAAKNVADMLNMLENGWLAQTMLLREAEPAPAVRVFDPGETLKRCAPFSRLAKPTVLKRARITGDPRKKPRAGER